MAAHSTPHSVPGRDSGAEAPTPMVHLMMEPGGVIAYCGADCTGGELRHPDKPEPIDHGPFAVDCIVCAELCPKEGRLR